jgi:hypothetical protein
MHITTNEELGAYVGELLSIDEKLIELKTQITAFRKSILCQLEPLQSRYHDLEKEIITFLQHNNLPGVQRSGKKVILHKQLLPVQREHRIKKVLEECQAKPNITVETITDHIITALKQRSSSPDDSKTILKISKIDR